MHSDWKGPFRRRLQQKASERGKRMAARRWALDRERRERLAKLPLELDSRGIVRRIVVIDQEREVREASIFRGDSQREERRKIRQVLKYTMQMQHFPRT